MTWQFLGRFLVGSEWTLTDVIPSEMIRVTHLSMPLIKNDYIKAVIGQGFTDDSGIVNIFNPQRLTSRQEKEIFYFPRIDCIEKRLAFKRLDKTDNIFWLIQIEVYQNMFFSSVVKQQTTNAQPTAEVSVTSTQKSTILSEKSEGTRRSFLIVNTGSSTVYCKYVPIGTDLANANITVSATNYDFTLVAGEKFIDSNATQNAIVGICSGVGNLANTKLKVTEYIYS